MRTVPENIPEDYYGWDGTAEKPVDDDKSYDERSTQKSKKVMINKR
jgi:hypothetical protein